MRNFKELVESYLLLEFVKYMKGHKNSKGEKAEWVIVSHTTGKVISSSKTQEEAKKRLRAIQFYKHH